jgi:hypothetical protein
MDGMFDWVDRVRDQIGALPPEVFVAIVAAVLVGVVLARRRRW